MHDGMPYGRIQGQGHEPIQGSKIENLQSREVDRQSPTGLIFFYIYICCFIIAVQMSTAGIFWSRSLCLSVIMLLHTKFRINQEINRSDIAEKRFSLWRPSAMLNLQNCGTLSSDRPWKRNLRLQTKLR